MPDLTPKLKLKQPLGNENVTREAYNENLRLIDENAASQARVDEPFYLKTAGFDMESNRLELIFGPGKASFLGNFVSFTRDTTIFLDNPLFDMAYFVYIKSDGTLVFNTNGGGIPGAVAIWKVVLTGETRQIHLEDLRGQLSGAGARIVQDNLTAHINAPDPHPMYATDNDLATHHHDSVYVKLSANSMVPPGVVNPFAGMVAPSGWLLCYGQAVSRSTYSGLFAIIGTAYGAGDGSSTFNVPDFRGRTPIGKDNMGGSSANRVTDANADIIGGSGGEEMHALTVGELAPHTHGGAPGRGTHWLTVYSRTGGSYLGEIDIGYTNVSSTGGGQPHNNMPPFVTLNYIIKY
jgi:microcystin-dependent protein